MTACFVQDAAEQLHTLLLIPSLFNVLFSYRFATQLFSLRHLAVQNVRVLR